LRKKYDDVKYRVMTIAAVMGNLGFFGMPVIRAVLPDNPEVACYSAVYMLSMNVIAFTMGVFCLTGEKKYMSVKPAIFNPTVFGFLLALPFFIFGLKQYLPLPAINAIGYLADMTTPLCMIILGIRLACVKFTDLFTRPVVYVTCALKLLVFPLFCYGLVYFLPLDFAMKASVLILSGTPCASIILNLAELHGAEADIPANCILLTTLLCFTTIPLLTLVL
ncbi:MAG: AEC family transporter, partial [Clostridia bacterium]|nr:AEC family transporter [Clostridia bacterium]